MTLQERLLDLTEPCREVDAEIANAFGKTAFVKSPYKSSCCECPHYTASLDAAIELVERELPIGDWGIHRDVVDYIAFVASRGQKWDARHTIPAVALLLALIEAKEAD